MRRRTIISGLMLGAAATPALATNSETSVVAINAVSTESANAQLPSQRQAALSLPLEDVLKSLAQRTGFSFIFDSRLIRGKSIAPIDAWRPPERALRERLRGENLALHKVNAKTFAITSQPIATAAAAPAAAVATPAIALADTIVVTGVASSALTNLGSRNLFVYDRGALDRAVLVNPAEAIFELPQSLASVSAANSSFLGASGGLNLADLRGFGFARTLVFVNGRRRTTVSGGNGTIAGFDISAVGEPFLERIEISGQSGVARFGPEAVAGVINFSTKSDIEGVEAGASFGVAEQGDAAETSLYVLSGREFFNGAGRITAGVNHARENGLEGGDRAITSSPYGFVLNGAAGYQPGAEFAPGYGGSVNTPDGAIAGVIANNGAFIPAFAADFPIVLDGAGGLEPSTGGLDQRYNWLTDTNTIIPINRTLGFLDGSLEVTDRTRLFLEAQIGASDVRVQIAPLPATSFRGVDPLIGNGSATPFDDPSITPEIRDAIEAEFGADVQSIIVSRRFEEVGPRISDISRRYNELVFGVEHEFSEFASLEAHYRFGLNQTNPVQQNRIDRDRLFLALDTPACSATPNCTPINLFVSGGVSREAADFIRAPELSRRIKLSEHEVAAEAQFDLGRVRDGVAANVGGAFRRTRLVDRDEKPADLTVLGDFNNFDFEGAINVGEFNLGLEAPLFRDDSVIGAVDLSLAHRVTASSLFNAAQNFEADIQWSPVDGATVVGGVAIGHRVPNISELFFVGRSAEWFFQDPCATGDPKYAANCASDGPLGVSEGFRQTRFIVQQTGYGNPDLELEDVRNLRVGASVDPTVWLDRFPGRATVSATWLDYRVRNAIQSENEGLEDCFSSSNFSSRACGLNPRTGEPLIARDPITEQIITADSVLANRGEFSWRGLDLEARLTLEPADLGAIDRVWLSGLHTYIDRVSFTSETGDLTIETGLAAYPRHQTLASAGVDVGDFQFSTLVRRRGRAESERFDLPETNIPPVTTFDVAWRWRLSDAAVATVNVENITNTAPPLVAFSERANTYPEFYDIVGRRFSVGVRASF